MKFKRKTTPAVVRAKPSSLWFHKPAPLCPLERDLVRIAINKSDIDVHIDMNDLLVVEREHTIVGSYTRMITKAKNDHRFEEKTLRSSNFSLGGSDLTGGSIVYLGVDGIDCIEMFSYGSDDFPKDFKHLEYQILED